jgi:hypothetical protein
MTVLFVGGEEILKVGAGHESASVAVHHMSHSGGKILKQEMSPVTNPTQVQKDAQELRGFRKCKGISHGTHSPSSQKMKKLST